MYDEDHIYSHGLSAMPQTATAALPREEEAVEVTLASLHRLRSAVVELSTALNETLRDERSNAAACLQRVKAMLQGADGAALQTRVNGVRQAGAPATHAPRDDISMQPSGSRVQQGLAPWQVRRVLAHIEASLGTPIRNKELAAIARLSTFHFNVAFRNSVGESPHAHIIRRRVERAQGLMLSTGKSLSEIAAECGFADQAHLTRLFRRIAGESPAAWRRARAHPMA